MLLLCTTDPTLHWALPNEIFELLGLLFLSSLFGKGSIMDIFHSRRPRNALFLRFPITEKLRTDAFFSQSFFCNQVKRYKEIYWIHINNVFVWRPKFCHRTLFAHSTICVNFNQISTYTIFSALSRAKKLKTHFTPLLMLLFGEGSCQLSPQWQDSQE